jgi:hypothetical protein
VNFAILNKNGSKISDFTEVKLLWTSILFSDRIIYATPFNSIFMAKYFFPKLPERKKINMIKIAMDGWDSKFKSTDLEKFYEQYLSIKKIKRKSREQLILLKQGERLINTYEKILLDNNDKILQNLKVSELKPFFWNHDENIIIPTAVSDNDPRPKEERSINYFETLSVMLTDDDVLPILDDSFIHDDNDIDFCTEKLLSVPAPESLKESQIRIIRNDFREKFNCFDGYEEYKQNLKEKPYAEYIIQKDGTESPICEEMEVNPEFQKSVDENIYIEQLRQNSTDGIEYSLFLGVTSFEDIVRTYHYLGILSDEDTLYVKEHLSNKVNLKNSTPFLYLKVKNKNGNN